MLDFGYVIVIIRVSIELKAYRCRYSGSIETCLDTVKAFFRP